MRALRTLAVTLSLGFVGIITAGCASAGAVRQGAREPGGLTFRVTEAEIRGINAGTAYGVVQSVRPNLLPPEGSSRGGSSLQTRPMSVYSNEGERLGGPEILKSIPRWQLVQLEFIDTDMAAKLYGPAEARGVIVVTLAK
jgi:hypothetical protein